MTTTGCDGPRATSMDSDCIIQDLLFYVESRFKTIIITTDRLQKASENAHKLKWINYCLRKELVSILFIRSFDSIYETLKISNSFLCSLVKHRLSGSPSKSQF